MEVFGNTFKDCPCKHGVREIHTARHCPEQTGCTLAGQTISACSYPSFLCKEHSSFLDGSSPNTALYKTEKDAQCHCSMLQGKKEASVSVRNKCTADSSYFHFALLRKARFWPGLCKAGSTLSLCAWDGDNLYPLSLWKEAKIEQPETKNSCYVWCALVRLGQLPEVTAASLSKVWAER